MNQLSLFSPVIPEKTLREEEHFGKMDAICGLPLRNEYSMKIGEARFARYERGYHNEISRLASVAG